MTLDEAIRRAHHGMLSQAGPTVATAREVLSELVEHAVAGHALRDLIDELASITRGLEPGPIRVVHAPEVPTLRDTFAMHAPLEPLPESLANNSAERNLLRNRTRVAYAYADFMLAARTARVERTS